MPPAKESTETVKEAPASEMVTREEAQRMARDAAHEAAELSAKRVLEMFAQQGKPADSDGDMRFARGLATALAEMSNQGTGKKIVDPQVLADRAKRREDMAQLIIDARVQKRLPRYELTATVHLHDRLVPPMWIDNFKVQHRTQIGWAGIPNEAMLPVTGDETAAAIYHAFCDSIGKAPGTRAMLMPVNSKGSLATPGGHVFEMLPAIPKGFDGAVEFEVEHGAFPAPETPATGLEVFGGASGGHQRKEVLVPVLGTIAEPARQLVA